MLKIINTSGQIDDLFDKGAFSRDKWREYINLIYEDSSYQFDKIQKNNMIFISDNKIYSYDKSGKMIASRQNN